MYLFIVKKTAEFNTLMYEEVERYKKSRKLRHHCSQLMLRWHSWTQGYVYEAMTDMPIEIRLFEELAIKFMDRDIMLGAEDMTADMLDNFKPTDEWRKLVAKPENGAAIIKPVFPPTLAYAPKYTVLKNPFAGKGPTLPVFDPIAQWYNNRATLYADEYHASAAVRLADSFYKHLVETLHLDDRLCSFIKSPHCMPLLHDQNNIYDRARLIAHFTPKLGGNRTVFAAAGEVYQTFLNMIFVTEHYWNWKGRVIESTPDMSPQTEANYIDSLFVNKYRTQFYRFCRRYAVRTEYSDTEEDTE